MTTDGEKPRNLVLKLRRFGENDSVITLLDCEVVLHIHLGFQLSIKEGNFV